jgi:hypothetical protein
MRQVRRVRQVLEVRRVRCGAAGAAAVLVFVTLGVADAMQRAGAFSASRRRGIGSEPEAH